MHQIIFISYLLRLHYQKAVQKGRTLFVALDFE